MVPAKAPSGTGFAGIDTRVMESSARRARPYSRADGRLNVAERRRPPLHRRKRFPTYQERRPYGVRHRKRGRPFGRTRQPHVAQGGYAMRTYDLAPLYRSTVGFDRLFSLLDQVAEKAGEVLYQGIAARAFERRFQLADHVEVKGASLENGLLHVDLKREIPEAMKPRQIPIGGGPAKVIDTKQAA